MKELTIEEKAQRYDEAIDRAKELLEIGQKDTRDKRVVLSFFPELREVGDEEVRKAMIDFFKHEREEGIAVLHYGVNIERMIAWLEKKGDRSLLTRLSQSSAWSEMDDKMLGEAIFHMEETIKYRTNKAILASANDVLSWLKSLKDRMTWQPSDEQMKRLKEACDEHWEPDGLDTLYTLYEDLKKLRV